MPNQDLDATWKYHNGTKHSYLSLRAHPHFLDWDNKPLLFKIYPTLEVTRLPKDFRQTGVSALSAIASPGVAAKGKKIPTFDDIAQLLFFSAGVTKSKKFPGGETFFRAAACTGALYEIELYLVCQDLPGLTAGVYHFGAAEFGLRQLRAGDYRKQLVDATGGEKVTAHAPLILICAGTYWRNAWKYRSRTYRHFGWDNGTLLANVLAMSTALGLPTKVVMGFVDQPVNALIDVDVKKEAAFSLVAVGHTKSRASADGMVGPLQLPIVAYSRQEQEYPAMRQMHEASSLVNNEESGAWRETFPVSAPPDARGKLIDLKSLAKSELPTDSIEQVIQRRGSTRRFAREPISFAQLSTLLDSATRGIPADFLKTYGKLLNDLYLIVHGVEGLAPGAYFFRREKKQLELLKEGDFRERAGYLGLEQDLPADASVDFFFLADLPTILGAFGNRGY
ncbi:MAG TPA: SagB family peptide dehydrogenase, partial [Terriglobales bacterium]|nr:SagB family peptide dehydrogenase [Terriglobales bacterium]